MNIQLVYVLLLVITYKILYMILNVKSTISAYFLFLLMIVGYFLTNNLDFKTRKKCNSIYINIIVFSIIYLCNKNINTFLIFLFYSIIQTLTQRFFKNCSVAADERYIPSLFKTRNIIKLLIDCSGILIGIMFSYFAKYEENWYEYLNYIMTEE